MTRRWPVGGVALAVLWLFVRGVPVDPVNTPLDAVEDAAGEFLIGLAIGLPIAFVLRRMYTPEIDLGGVSRAIPPTVAYVTAFLVELITANLEVAYRVLSPSMPIDPEVVELPLRVESDVAITTIANSITMTPGTLTMDYDEERNALYVHAIYCQDPADVAAPIREWEDYALRMFDEPATPDTDPDPARLYDPDDPGDRPETVDSKDTEAGGDADGE
jgi:multicomponent Na+:H+ antiporter subunit E